MIIVVGLGNPGEKFKATRHNVGFMAVDFFAKKNSFPDFVLEKKYESLVSEDKKVLLAKPQTFMNKSGVAVGKIAKSYKLKAKSLIVIHDDIDLPLGKFKIVINRGSAGHKGVESIMKAIGNKNLVRFRVGVQPPKGKPKEADKFIIKDFTPDELKIINKAIKQSAEALDSYIENGLEKTMNEFNR